MSVINNLGKTETGLKVINQPKLELHRLIKRPFNVIVPQLSPVFVSSSVYSVQQSPAHPQTVR